MSTGIEEPRERMRLSTSKPCILGSPRSKMSKIELIGGHQGGVSLGATGHMIHGRARCAQGAQQTIGQDQDRLLQSVCAWSISSL
jgi:hypothetical protein